MFEGQARLGPYDIPYEKRYRAEVTIEASYATHTTTTTQSSGLAISFFRIKQGEGFDMCLASNYCTDYLFFNLK